MKKPLPNLKTDKEAEDFLNQDLSGFLDPSNFQQVTFEFEPKNKKITLRMSNNLYDAVKAVAEKKGINYQKIIRDAIEKYVRKADEAA